MQRVVSINLDGNAYQIEEQGYNALFAYIDAAETALQDSPDRAQKLSDLERVTAEKCQACLGPHKTVVTSAEIDRILLELEPIPSQPAAQPPPNPSNPSNPSTPSNPSNPSGPGASSAHRRLFQIREGAMIGGVCVGLSEFLHIDVTIIRILFVVFALATAGWGMLAYGVLMFVVPRVDTRAEASSGTASGSMPPHHWPWDDGWRDSRERWREQRREWREQRHAARMAQPHPHAFSTFTMIVFLMIGFMWLSFWTRGHFFFGWPFFWGFPHWMGIVIFFIMLRLIFMPFRAARWYGYGPYSPYPPHYVDHPHYAWAAMWNGLAWFMAMIFFVWIAYHYIPEVHEFIRSFQTSWSDGGFHV